MTSRAGFGPRALVWKLLDDSKTARKCSCCGTLCSKRSYPVDVSDKTVPLILFVHSQVCVSQKYLLTVRIAVFCMNPVFETNNSCGM